MIKINTVTGHIFFPLLVLINPIVRKKDNEVIALMTVSGRNRVEPLNKGHFRLTKHLSSTEKLSLNIISGT